MADNATSDFEAAFAEATLEVEAGGGAESTIVSPKKQNARVHMGDGEVIDPQATEDDDTDGEVETDEGTDDENVSDETSSTDESTDPEVFDWAEHKDKSVVVKVNGADVSVPLGEAMSGYMRHADYTRKTQALGEQAKIAEWGNQMREALQADPQSVIFGMAEAFGVKLTPGVQAPDPYTSDDPDLQPVLSELKATKAQLSQMQQALDAQANDRVQADVRAELASVQSKYSDFDPNEVLPVAIRTGLDMESAYFLVRGQKNQTTAAAEAAAKAKIADVAAAEAKKRLVAKTTASTAGRKAAETGKPEPKMDSFEEMLNYELSKSR